MGKKPVPFSGHHIVSCKPEKRFDKFFVIHTISSSKETFETVSPFLVQRAIVSTIGEVNSIRKLRSGDLLVEVNSLKQAQQIVKLKSLETIQISVTPHRTLNSCKGVITCG
ncbi:hypothetical protein AVEN_2701-1 [Araneus ventricosus]|uniref:Uncharacterized protein n=1 Tax=Araneus ventricosus TaxID=182803 RepID=A0A4Y2QSZ4_ARAVE|nr:hypothetical protein AVEN_2701-1 [Araneus ventricosus]